MKTLEKITQLEPFEYTNSTKLFTLGKTDFYLWDVVKTALAARLNIGLYGGAGLGKSQLFSDVRALFGNNSSYVLGRNDLDIKALFRQLNFKDLSDAMKNGRTVAQKDLTKITKEIYKPLIVVEEINRCAEVVQNQLFNVFEGFIELEGEKYPLGGGNLQTFNDLSGRQWQQNVKYSVGVWTANFGDEYSGTSSIDKALRERTHLIIDVDNFIPGNLDLDMILVSNAGEIRLKDQEKAKDHTALFADAFRRLKQKALTPDPYEMGKELLLFRYLILGLDYIPCTPANNSKRIMKQVWPIKAEEDDIGKTDDEKIMNRMVYPASIRSALSIMTLARALREYAGSESSVIDSVAESIKICGAYSGMIRNTHRIREYYVGNMYRAASDAAEIIRKRLKAKSSLIDAIVSKKIGQQNLSASMLKECRDEYQCFR